jgi:RNA polymerase sigma-70 factor (ECF subfamily)
MAIYNVTTLDPDRQDIAASLGGDEAAFARLVRRHEAAVANLLWRFTRQPAQREELVQETFVEAYFGLGRFRGEAPLEHWLRRIATRVAAPDGPGDPAAAGAAAHALLARLPPAERLVLTLMYFDDCQIKDIARRMGWTRAMVKMRAYRARRRLKAIAGREHLLERLGWTS